MGAGGGQTGTGATALATAKPASLLDAPPPDIRLLALAFLAGLFVLHCLPSLPPPASLLPLWLLAWLRFPGRALYLAFLLALTWGCLHGLMIQADRLPESRHGEIRWLRGHVSGLPEKDGRRLRFQFETDESPSRIRVSWYGEAPEMTAGQCWRLKLRLSSPRGSANPGGFDYEAWLWRKRIAATAYVREAERCDQERFTLDRMRQALSAKLEYALEGRASSGVIRALTLGDRNGISDDQWAGFRKTGTSHLVAISGLHIGLIAGVAYFLLRLSLAGLARPGRMPVVLMASVGSVLFAGLYAALAGFALPAQRAFIAVLVVALALLLRRNILPSQLLALAMLAVLVFDPFALLAPGFWLSFAAVGWILYLLGGRIGKGGRWRRLLLLQPALVLALAPLTLYWFGEASLVAPLANALLIPLFAILLPLLFLAVLLFLLLPQAGLIALNLLATGMDYGLAGLGQAAQLSLSHIQLPQPQVWEVGVAILALLLLLAPRGIPFRWVGVIGLLPLLLGPVRPGSGEYRLTAIDVGQGLAVLVETRTHTLLFDAGPRYPGGFDAGEAIVVPLLRSRGIGRLDLFVQSHGDIDHRGGAEAVIAAFLPTGILGRDGHPACVAGQSWRWDGVLFEIIHPDRGQWSGNNASCVLRISGEGGGALLTGDIERAAETALVAERGQTLASRVLVVAHHGSNTSSTQAFIDAVDPDYALVSAGWRNRWGFPDTHVIRRFATRQQTLLVTGDSGAIELLIGASEPIEVRQWRIDQPRLWRPGP